MSDGAEGREAEQPVSVDAFHRGAFWLAQPRQGGHRAGMDAMTLAASVPTSFRGRLADLGAGAGAAGLAVLSRCEGATALLAERAPEMARLARRTLALPQNAWARGRAEVLECDVALAGEARQAAGLADRAFDFAIMNPPFNLARDRATPDPLRRQAHVMEDGLLEAWLRTAAAILRPGGRMAVIARPHSLDAVLAAIRGRFGGAELLPVLPRADAPAIRFVLRAARGSRKEPSIHPPLVLHEETGSRFSPHAERICNGEASLFGD